MNYCIFCMNQLPEHAERCPVCGHQQTAQIPLHHLPVGTMLAGRYLIGTAIGEGGFGITYIGHDTKLDMTVAVKEYYPNGYVSRSNTVSCSVSYTSFGEQREVYEKGRERFLQEARILAKFSGSSGIVDVRDFFEANGTAYIVMEYLKGQTLKNYLNTVGVISPEETVRMLMPVIVSLKEVHAQGLIHRDISPDNIMLTKDKVKLLDFGAARNVSAMANKSISVILKPGYAPEEQYRSKGNQGPWTDIYALCATMYKCMTGVTPDDAPERLRFDEIKAPSVLGIAIRPELEKAIMKGMQVRQEDRFRTIDELLAALNGRQDVQAPEIAAYDDLTIRGGTSVGSADADEQTVLSDAVRMQMDDATVYQGQTQTMFSSVNAGEDETVMLNDRRNPPAGVMPVMENPNPGADQFYGGAQPEPSDTKKKGLTKKSKIIITVCVILAVLVAAAGVLFFVLSRSKNDNGGDKAISQKNEDSTADTDNEKEETEPGYLPKDFSLTIDDAVYQNFPLSVQEFCDLGWQFDDVAWSIDDTLNGKSYTVVDVINQHNTIAVIGIINDTQDELSLSLCTVCSIAVLDMQEGSADYSAIYCTDNIVLGESTPDDVLAAYGDPYYRDDDVGVFAYFITDQQCEVEFCFGEQNILIGICIRYDYDYEDYDYDSGIDYDENAGCLPSDFALTIDDSVYQDFPLSIQGYYDLGWQFVADGWQETDFLDSHVATQVTLFNQQNTKAEICIKNETENDLQILSCDVYSFFVSTFDNTEDCSNIYCTGDIVLGKSTADDVLSAYGDPDYRNDDTRYWHYYTNDRQGQVAFMFNEQNQLEVIEWYFYV